MKTLTLLLVSVTLFGADTKYIVHWTTDEPCHECNQRFAVACLPSVPDCGVPRKAVDHFEVAESKDAALKIANEIGDLTTKPASTYDNWTAGTIGGMPTIPRPKGILVAIYESRALIVEKRTETIETPQPPKVETKIRVALK